MSTSSPDQGGLHGGPPPRGPYAEEPSRLGLYVLIGAVVLFLMVLGVIIYNGNEETREARDQADQFIAALEAAGVENPPSQEQVIGVLGTDGGATCADPTEALAKSGLFAMLSNGASGPGMRPIIADSRVVQGQLLVIETYCPDELERFRAIVDDLKTDAVASDG